MSTATHARVLYEVPRVRDDWTLSEEPVPESQTHDLVLDLLKALLLAWVERSGRSAQVARNLAVRWDEAHPSIGADPDLCVIEPRTPEGDELVSLCTWRPEHHAPVLAIEVVSESNARKDYISAPERYAAAGVRELWVFDPKRSGPRAHGGPHRLQVWQLDDAGTMRRLYAGEGPAFSPELGAWLVPVDEGRRLRIAEDAEATRFWMTREEAARAAKETERAAKESALARVAELEAELSRLRGG